MQKTLQLSHLVVILASSLFRNKVEADAVKQEKANTGGHGLEVVDAPFTGMEMAKIARERITDEEASIYVPTFGKPSTPILVIPQSFLEEAKQGEPGEVPEEFKSVLLDPNVRCVYLGNPDNAVEGYHVNNAIWAVPGLQYMTAVESFDDIDWSFHAYMPQPEPHVPTLDELAFNIINKLTSAGKLPFSMVSFRRLTDRLEINLEQFINLSVNPEKPTVRGTQFGISLPAVFVPADIHVNWNGNVIGVAMPADQEFFDKFNADRNAALASGQGVEINMKRRVFVEGQASPVADEVSVVRLANLQALGIEHGANPAPIEFQEFLEKLMDLVEPMEKAASPEDEVQDVEAKPVLPELADGPADAPAADEVKSGDAVPAVSAEEAQQAINAAQNADRQVDLA